MAWIFLEFELQRLESFVASYAKSVFRFLVRKMGFTWEGTLRQAWPHKGILQDLEVLSILRNEVQL